MASNDTDWKRKYYTALDEQENKEKDWGKMEALLKLTLSRLSLAVEGVDEELDEQINILRDAIRKKAPNERFQSVMESLSRRLIQMEEIRSAEVAAKAKKEDKKKASRSISVPKESAPSSSAPPGLQTIKAMQYLVNELPVSEKAMKDQDKLRLALAKFSEGQRIEPFVIEVFNYLKKLTEPAPVAPVATGGRASPQNSALEEQKEDKKEKKKGLLERLFSSDGKAADAEQSAPPEEPKKVAKVDVSVFRQVLHLVIEQIKSRGAVRSQAEGLADDLAKAEGIDAMEGVARDLSLLLQSSGIESATAVSESDTPSLSEVLLQLLEQLSLPAEMTHQVDFLKAKLEQGVADAEWEQVLRDIALLISEMRLRVHAEKRDLEEFLKELTENLQALDSSLRGTRHIHAQGLESGLKLDEVVQTEVEAIQESVNAASDLMMLKQSVQGSLTQIRGHIASHREAELSRVEMLEKEMTHMSAKVVDLERESGQLRTRIVQERHQALKDALTGVPNRMAYDEKIEEEVGRWKRFHNPLSLLIWDVDRFKNVNDTYGHKAGDKVLQIVAHRLSSSIRQTDFIARYGGEEFALLMPGTSAEEALDVANKLRLLVADTPFHHGDQLVTITISCGIGEFREGDDHTSVFERADAALYRAKQAGRNQCMIG